MENLRRLRKLQMVYFFTVGSSLAVIFFVRRLIVVIFIMLLLCGEIQTILSQNATAGASILGGWGGTRPPRFFDWGDEYLIVPPIFFICSMKFNSTLFSVYCGHCLSLSILLNIIQIQTRSHMLTQSCFFSNFLRCY